jgi:hypothetical protein
MQIRSVGIDLGKTTFHLVALGTAGKVLVRRKFSQPLNRNWPFPGEGKEVEQEDGTTP